MFILFRYDVEWTNEHQKGKIMKYLLQVFFSIIFASLLMISCLAQANLKSSIPQAQKFDEFVLLKFIRKSSIV